MTRSIKRRKFLKTALQGAGIGLAGVYALPLPGKAQAADIRIGVVGLAVHSAAFSQILNDPQKAADVQGCKIVALYHPPGNPDVDFTKEQLAGFEKTIRDAGVKIVPTMNEMLALCDVVMIETNDGRPHFNEVMPALKAGKPVFVDKPVAENLAGVLKIFDAAAKMKVPIFTSSALRYVDNIATIDKSKVLGADTYSPAALEKSHTDLFWYGIHAVEPLFAVMGAGCTEVMQPRHSENEDLVIGFWDDRRTGGRRTGTVRGLRSGKRGFGGTFFTENSIVQMDTFTGYRSLVVQVVSFFKTKIPPVPAEETIEIYAFMEAAMESRKNGGKKVNIAETIAKARKSNHQ
ncbi:Gfo/Idh/MocA family oxidoreductase [Ravibacter arvi]|uniref:Gfo/Idh/MocA family oxidoreductase n=1 Tax=Ravibacter arvi TaxID=2051041 RepID=A0ABP8M8J8_9BACT